MEKNKVFTLKDTTEELDKLFNGGRSFLLIAQIYEGYTLGEDVWEYLSEKETEGLERKKGSLLRECLVVDLFNRLPHSYIFLKKRLISILFEGCYFIKANYFELFMEGLVNNTELSQFTMKKYLESKNGPVLVSNQIELELKP